MSSHCNTNNANRSHVSLSSTATFYLALCIVLYTHRCNSLNYRTGSMRCCMSHNEDVSRACDKQTSTTANVIDDTAYSSARAPSWTQATVTDGHTFSAVKRMSRWLLDRSKNAILPIPPTFSARIGVIPFEFRRDLFRHKTRVPGLLCCLFA